MLPTIQERAISSGGTVKRLRLAVRSRWPQEDHGQASTLDRATHAAGPSPFCNLETGEPIVPIRDRLVTANAYLGAAPVAEALLAGCRIVITGRVADPSLAVAPCVASFGWSWRDWDRIAAAAAIAGHLIECGAQVTGGVSTDWLDIPDPAHIGFPIAEVAPDGCVHDHQAAGHRRARLRTNHQGTTALRDRRPGPLPHPGRDRLVPCPARGRRWAPTACVSGRHRRPAAGTLQGRAATYRAGFRAAGTLTIFGRHAAAKAERCGRIVLNRLSDAGLRPQQWARRMPLQRGLHVSGSD